MDQQLQEFRDQAIANYRYLATRLEMLETNRDNTAGTDAQYIKSVKVDTPSFDGRLDLQGYIDWQFAMDRYLCSTNTSIMESCCVRNVSDPRVGYACRVYF